MAFITDPNLNLMRVPGDPASIYRDPGAIAGVQQQPGVQLAIPGLTQQAARTVAPQPQAIRPIVVPPIGAARPTQTAAPAIPGLSNAADPDVQPDADTPDTNRVEQLRGVLRKLDAVMRGAAKTARERELLEQDRLNRTRWNPPVIGQPSPGALIGMPIGLGAQVGFEASRAHPGVRFGV